MANPSPEIMRAATRQAAGLNRAEVIAVPGLTAAQQQVVGEVLGQINADRGHEALGRLAAGATYAENPTLGPQTHFAHGNWENIAQAKIYSDFTPTGERQARGAAPGVVSPETTRFNEVRSTMQAYTDYMEHGYDDLTGTPAEQANKRAVLRERVRTFIRSTPPLRDALEDATGNIPAPRLEAMLRNEQMQSKLAEVLNTEFNEEALPSDEGVIGAHERRTQLPAEITTLTTQRTTQVTRRATATTEKTNFDTVANYSVAGGVGFRTKAQAMGLISADLMANTPDPTTGTAQAITNAQKHNANIRNIARNLDDLQTENTSPTPNRDRLRILQEQIGDALQDARARAYNGLFEERKTNDTNIADANTKIADLDTQIAAKNSEQFRNTATRDTEGLKRQTKGADFATIINQAMGKAAEQIVAERAKNFIDRYDVARTTITAARVTEHTPHVAEHLENRWIENGRNLFGRPVIRLRRNRARDDVNMIAAGNTDHLVHEITEESLIASGLTHAQAQAQTTLLMEDETYRNARAAEVTAQALAAYAASGFRLNDRMLESITRTHHGQEALNAMMTAEDHRRHIVHEAHHHTHGTPAANQRYTQRAGWADSRRRYGNFIRNVLWEWPIHQPAIGLYQVRHGGQLPPAAGAAHGGGSGGGAHH